MTIGYLGQGDGGGNSDAEAKEELDGVSWERLEEEGEECMWLPMNVLTLRAEVIIG